MKTIICVWNINHNILLESISIMVPIIAMIYNNL
uniref:Uncharacterized protein n=1 Tax=Arundo donax TaxID=35708 RepID=A0A0A9HVT4_ARUDO